MLNLPQATRSEIAYLGGAYFAFFALVGLMVPYLSVYLDRLGYDSKSIGSVLAIVATMRIVAPSMWSAIADKTGYHLQIARLGALLALLSLLLLFWVETRSNRLLVLAAFNFFWTAILPQIEVTSLRRLAATEGLYAKVRSAGSIGFTLIATFAGIVITAYGANAFVVIALLLCGSLLVVLTYVDPVPLVISPMEQVEKKQKLLTRPLLGLIGCCFLIQTSHGSYYTFFILYMHDLGYSSLAAGGLSSIGVFAEIALFWQVRRLFGRWSTLNLFQFAIGIAAIRWLLMAWFADVFVVLVLALLMHAASFGVIHASAMRWLQQHVDKRQQATAQALYSGMGFGAGSVAGAAIAGSLWQDGQGATWSYLACAGVALLAMGLFQLTLKQTPIPPSLG